MAGTYRLTIVATVTPRKDSVVHGFLHLQAQEVSAPAWKDVARVRPLWGWSDIDFLRIAPIVVAHSPASRNPRRPGVQVAFDSLSRRLTLTFGNSEEYRSDGTVAFTTDIGVILFAFLADERRIVGRWEDGGRSSRPAQGYFCADRVQT